MTNLESLVKTYLKDSYYGSETFKIIDINNISVKCNLNDTVESLDIYEIYIVDLLGFMWSKIMDNSSEYKK